MSYHDAMRVMAGLSLDVATQPRAPYGGTTPTVFPGAIATGAADPAAEERFNIWMDGFINMAEAHQRGVLQALVQKEAAGTLTPDETRQIRFARNVLGITSVPEYVARPGEKPAEVVDVNVVGKRPNALAMFLMLLGAGAVALVASGKSAGK